MNHTKKYLKIYTGQATKLDLVLWLRDEWSSVLARNIYPRSDDKNNFLTSHFTRLLFKQLGIKSVDADDFDFIHTSRFFVSNPIIFKILTSNSLLCLDNLNQTSSKQQKLSDIVPVLSTRKPYLYSTQNINSLLDHSPSNLRYIRVGLNNDPYMFYDLQDYNIDYTNGIQYVRIPIEVILRKYMFSNILTLKSRDDIIKECDESKIFEFIKPNHSEDLKLFATLVLGLPEVYKEYAINQTILGEFRKYALTKIFDKQRTESVLTAEQLGADNTTLTEMLINDQYRANETVELPDISLDML